MELLKIYDVNYIYKGSIMGISKESQNLKYSFERCKHLL